jgi:uncharacterized membrane protein
MGYSKAILVPLLAVVFMIVEAITGVKVSEDLQHQVASVIDNAVVVGAILYGTFKNFKKDNQDKEK